MEKQTGKQLTGEILRFLLVGGTATLVDYLLFWLLDGVLLPLFSTAVWWQVCSLIFSTAVGFCAGLLVNWVLSVKFVFKSARHQVGVRDKKAFAVFAVIGLVGLLLTEIGVLLLVWLLPTFSLFGRTAILGTLWKKWLARAIMTALVLVWNYLGRKLIVFKEQNN